MVLWPAYFDSTNSRSEGRGISKTLARPSPNVYTIEKAIETLGLPYEIIPEAAYPRSHWNKTGLILVKKDKSKNQILKDVAAVISRLPV